MSRPATATGRARGVRTPTGGRRLAFTLLTVLLPSVAACGLLSRDPPPPCPRAAVVRGADTVTVYRPGAERTGANVRYLGAVTDLASACRYEGGGVAVDLALALVVEQGPAYAAGPASLTYVVGIVAPDGDLLARQTFSTEIAIPEDAERAGVVEKLALSIPGASPQNAGAYRILLGFELGDEEVRRRTSGTGGEVAPIDPG